MPRAQTARDSRLTLDELLDHTADLIDTGGIDAVTFRALAARCHVGPATLYQYVETKDGLLGLYVDRLLGTIDAPSENVPWGQAAHQVFTGVYKILAAHPELAQILARQATPGAEAVRLLRVVIASLARAGFSRAQITTAYDVLAAYTAGFVQQHAGRHQREPDLAQLLATNLHPDAAPHRTDAERFDAGLSALIAGLNIEACPASGPRADKS